MQITPMGRWRNMGEFVSKFTELLPFVRDGSPLLKIAFIAWSIATAILLVLMGVEYLARPAKLVEFTVDLTPDRFIDERYLLLKGAGLPIDASLKVRVFAVPAGGVPVEVTQDAKPLRAADGHWRIQWLKFQHAGTHNIIVEVWQKDRIVASPDPIRVIVGSWVSSPIAAAGSTVSDPAVVPLAKKASEPITDVRIRDSGPEGSVVGLVVATALETAYALAGHPLPYVSARFIYERSKRLNDMDVASEGAMLAQGVQVAEFFGVFAESIWPYAPGKHDLPTGKTWNQLDRLAIETGLRGKFTKLTTVDAAIDALRQRRPVVAGMEVREGLFNYHSGILDSTKGSLMGLHAVVLTDYDTGSLSFRFANSWGVQWGEGGFGRLSLNAARELLSKENLWAVEVKQ